MNHSPEKDELNRFRGARYLKSLPDVQTAGWQSEPGPGTDGPWIAFVGRSNSGKSSLISALTGHKNLAQTSKTAGKTRMLNLYHIPERKDPPYPTFYFVDTPGYGYARISESDRIRLQAMVDDLLVNAPGLIYVVVVLDARRSIREEELRIIEFARQNELPLIFARTRWDKLGAKEKKDARKQWKFDGIEPYCIPISSTKMIGLVELARYLNRTLDAAFESGPD